MLIYNLKRIYNARGIERPYSFFKSNGFSDSFSAKLRHGKVTGMKLETLERLCEMLNCTPHDLLEWEPDRKSKITSDHPLRILESKNKPPDLTTVLKSAPLDKMNKFKEFIESETKKDLPG